MSSSTSRTTVIQADGDSLPRSSPSKLHFVPASTDLRGEKQDVCAFFAPSVGADPSRGCATATLRGRPLDGQVQDLPEGFSCVVVQAGRGDGLGEDRERRRNLRAVKTAESFTAWNYDRVPSGQDQLRKALDYLKLAEVLHSAE